MYSGNLDSSISTSSSHVTAETSARKGDNGHKGGNGTAAVKRAIPSSKSADGLDTHGLHTHSGLNLRWRERVKHFTWTWFTVSIEHE